MVYFKIFSKLIRPKAIKAKNTKSLENIYKEIDKLEKTEVDVAFFNNYTEEFLFFALIAFGLISLENILKYTIFRVNP